MQVEHEHLRDHDHLHDHDHDQEQADESPISTSTIIFMVLFSLGYMISEPNLDGFNIEEALEYIFNSDLDSIPVHITGAVTSFIENIPLLAAIIYCWFKKNHDHHHHEDHHDGEQEHQHSLIQEGTELVLIGWPFAVMGFSAYLDSIKELIKGFNNLPKWKKGLAYSGAPLSGLITGFGAYKLHSFHIHDSIKENGGFFKGLYVTFLYNVWAARNEHDSYLMKVLAVANEAWKKLGIVANHGFLGLFAADVFLEQTGLKDKYLALEITLKTILPIAIMLYEGNTEARSLDIFKRRQGHISYSKFSMLMVILSGVLHTIPSLTALAKLMGSRTDGPGEGKLYNSLTYLAAAVLLAYPSIYGFTATTIEGFDKALDKVTRGLYRLVCGAKSQKQEGASNDIEADNPSGCAKLLSVCGLFRSESAQSEQRRLAASRQASYEVRL